MLTDATPPPSPLLEAGRVLAERGVYGLVWVSADLFVNARFGRLVDFIEIGEPLIDACLPLIGLEGEIGQLRTSPGRVLDLPAVMIATPDDSLPRINLTLFWYEQEQHYLMLVARATSRSDLEGELSRQMRARLMAEADAAEKSRELARANTELARANRDLEDFAGIISHDLQSPLRALRYASEEMTSRIEAGDTEGARFLLDDIADRTRRMSQMMTSLLDYASVGRKAEIAEPVATRRIVEDIVHSLSVPPGFEIAIEGEWPSIDTARAALDLVLRNLIQNAIVHHDRDKGRIVVAAKARPRTLLVTVADDGPGIAPAHHKTILMPFRTLAQKPGSRGMGLAFVNRTVDTIGGTLTIQSDPKRQRGTTFRLIWPRVVKG